MGELSRQWSKSPSLALSLSECDLVSVYELRLSIRTTLPDKATCAEMVTLLMFSFYVLDCHSGDGGADVVANVHYS